VKPPPVTLPASPSADGEEGGTGSGGISSGGGSSNGSGSGSTDAAPRSDSTKEAPESSRRRRPSSPAAQQTPSPAAKGQAESAKVPAPLSPAEAAARVAASGQFVGLSKTAIPGMPSPMAQTPVEAPTGDSGAAGGMAAAPMHGAPAVHSLPAGGKRIEGAQPLLLGEFTADDLLLWLQTTAFKKRVGPQAAEGGGARARILEEVRTLKRKFGTVVPPSNANEYENDVEC